MYLAQIMHQGHLIIPGTSLSKFEEAIQPEPHSRTCNNNSIGRKNSRKSEASSKQKHSLQMYVNCLGIQDADRRNASFRHTEPNGTQGYQNIYCPTYL